MNKKKRRRTAELYKAEPKSCVTIIDISRWRREAVDFVNYTLKVAVKHGIWMQHAAKREGHFFDWFLFEIEWPNQKRNNVRTKTRFFSILCISLEKKFRKFNEIIFAYKLCISKIEN
jgi:hypothetical protein